MKSTFQRFRLFAAISIHDFLVSWIAFVIAVALRVGMDEVWHYGHALMTWGVLFAAIAALTYRMIGLSSSIWRYTSFYDLKLVAVSAVISVAIWTLIQFSATGFRVFPRTVSFIVIFVLIAAMGLPRLVYRMLRDRRDSLKQPQINDDRHNVLLVGASDQTASFIQLMHSIARNLHIVGVIDHKGSRIGRSIHGVPIIDHIGNIGAVIDGLAQRGKAPDRVILCYPIASLKPGVFPALARDCADRNVRLIRQPDIADIMAEEHAQASNALASDLLGRQESSGLAHDVADLIRDKRVVVTGAGGTIGSELVRQIAMYEPAGIGLLDHSEFNLYAIGQELGESDPKFQVESFLCDIRNRAKLDRIFARFAPHIVIHAAALKHVPIVEANPCEGLLTNVSGTINVADAARAASAEAFVLISTDKAVNPTSVLGFTKRIAELYTGKCDREAVAAGSATRFIAVRFGNVIGSSGSVIPKFKHQIEIGGPVSVTHPEMTRYFMTTGEAVGLVLQATSRSLARPDDRGQILVLKMGRPVKIVDIARQMISLAGYVPDKDIAIEFTGLRPGEKLNEDLFDADEEVEQREGEDFMIATSHSLYVDLGREATERLFQQALRGDDAAVHKALKTMMGGSAPIPRPENAVATALSREAAK